MRKMVGLFLAPIATVLLYTMINQRKDMGTAEYNLKCLVTHEPLLSQEIHFMGNIRAFDNLII